MFGLSFSTIFNCKLSFMILNISPYCQFSAFCDHYIINPTLRSVKIIKLEVIIHLGDQAKDSGIGSMILSSTSKIKNKMVIIKNRIEKVFRFLCCGSNPHSNGDIFSRFFWPLVFKNFDSIIKSKINPLFKKRIINILLS